MSKLLSLAAVAAVVAISTAWAVRALYNSTKPKQEDSQDDCTEVQSKTDRIFQEAVKTIDEMKAATASFCTAAREILAERQESKETSEDNDIPLADGWEPGDYKEY